MTSWARPGIKCVCIKTGAWSIEGMNDPTFGQVLTIRSTYVGTNGHLYLRFIEIHNNPMKLAVGFLEPGFRGDRFRPLVTKTQDEDVAMFKRIIETAPRELT